QVARGQFQRIQPQAHRIFALAENDHVAHAFDALQRVAHIEVEIIADEQIVVLVILRVEPKSHHKRARVLVDANAGSLYFHRQSPESGGGAVLHVDSSDIQVAVQVKHHVDAAGSVVTAGGTHVAHAFRAVDGLFQ